MSTKSLLIGLIFTTTASMAQLPEAQSVLSLIDSVNTHWQTTHPLKPVGSGPFKPYSNNSPFWDNAAYHTGNMEAYKLTGKQQYLDYSLLWAEANEWQGAKGTDKAAWRYNYGESDNHVLFGDWQICFQTYCDLYNVEQDTTRIARAIEVMTYEMSTPNNDYWWWADGLYMVMPVMTKLYNITGDTIYLDKLNEYWTYASNLMYDTESHLFYRDGKYIYPKHKSVNGVKDFWARGDGWVLAGLAKVIADLPDDCQYKAGFVRFYKDLAEAVKNCQQAEGYWTRSLLDPEHAPGPETSGTAFFTYGLLWGINNGLLNKDEYLPAVERAWHYLETTALQDDYSIGYVQPIGEKAIPGQVVNQKSTANFGVGAFLLASCEMYRYVCAK